MGSIHVPRRVIAAALLAALILPSTGARSAAQTTSSQGKPSQETTKQDTAKQDKQDTAKQDTSSSVWDLWADLDDELAQYEDAWNQWMLFLLQLYVNLVRAGLPGVLQGATSTEPPKPPKPPDPPKNPDIIDIKGDSSTPEEVIPLKGDSSTQTVDVIPTSGDSSGPVDEVMDAAAGYMPIALLRRPPANAGPFVVFAAAGEDAMEMRVISPTALDAAQVRVLIRGEMALMPVAPQFQQRIAAFVSSATARGSGAHVRRFPMQTYCLEEPKRAGFAGQIFVPASLAKQGQYAQARVVRMAAEYASRRGLLKPQGDAASYGRFIAQYAIWTTLERWDERAFTEAFVRRTRNAARDAHHPWTGETEQTLRTLAPGRWADIQQVLQAARTAQAKRSKAGRRPGADR